MSLRCDDLTEMNKSVYTASEMTPFVFDLVGMLKDIEKIDTVESVYIITSNEKLEFYVFYEKENFEIEDKIMTYFTNWEENYRYFPEMFVYPLDMIQSKEDVLPNGALKF